MEVFLELQIFHYSEEFPLLRRIQNFGLGDEMGETVSDIFGDLGEEIKIPEKSNFEAL